MAVSENRLTHCCYAETEWKYTQVQVPGVDVSSDLEESVIRFMNDKAKLVEQFEKDAKSTPCYGCSKLVKEYFKKSDLKRLNFKLDSINIALSSTCQLSCYYCGLTKQKDKITLEKNKLIKNFDYSKFFEILINNNFLSEDLSVILASGEISILPNKTKLFNCINGYPLKIFTNAVLYDQQIADLKAIEYMSISIDAGTDKTYKKVKGLDVFSKVWDNVKRYKDNGINVVLKYIFLPENCNDADVAGFINNAVRAGVYKIEISADVCREVYDDDEMRKYIVKMISMCNECNIQYSLFENTIGVKNVDIINKILAS